MNYFFESDTLDLLAYSFFFFFFLAQITFANQIGRFDLDVTTFQMAVLFAWNQRPNEKIPYENLRLATELPDPELRRTLWVQILFLLMSFWIMKMI